MKNRWLSRVIAFVLAGAMTVCLASAAAPTVKVYAEETEGGSENTGKYVSDVFIAYGKTEIRRRSGLRRTAGSPSRVISTPARPPSGMTISWRRTMSPRSWASNGLTMRKQLSPIWQL